MRGTCNDATILATFLSWTSVFHRCTPPEMQRFCNDFPALEKSEKSGFFDAILPSFSFPEIAVIAGFEGVKILRDHLLHFILSVFSTDVSSTGYLLFKLHDCIDPSICHQEPRFRVGLRLDKSPSLPAGSDDILQMFL